MIHRFISVIATLLLFSLPASAIDSPLIAESALGEAARRMSVGDYRGAISSAAGMPESGTRDFLVAMAQFKLGELENAASLLGKSTVSLPLLADYSMLNHAQALKSLSRYPEALSILRVLLKSYPDSPLIRSAEKLMADTLYDSGNFSGALDSYRSFIEKHPSGNDSLEAMYMIARCNQKMGNIPATVNSLRSIWINYPASAVSEKAEKDLESLSASGTPVRPVTSDELMRRGNTLYDLRVFDNAEETFNAVLEETGNADLRYRLMLKIGQSRFKQRKFKGAEQILRNLINAKPANEIADEATTWIAKTLDKTGRDEEAVALYEAIANSTPASPMADNALLAAYFIKKFQNRKDDALQVLKRLETKYPGSNLLSTVHWEIAMHYYCTGDYRSSATYLKKLLGTKSHREKALFWYARATSAAGEKVLADRSSRDLLAEFPSGYYALNLQKDTVKEERELLSQVAEQIQEPKGLERPKALIGMGLYDEAKRELRWTRRRNDRDLAALNGIARLYLKMSDFHGASTTIDAANHRPLDRDSLAEWSIAYPLAFRESVARNAAENGITETLVYSVMRAESNYKPTAVSPTGAIGLMQLMPATAAVILPSGSGKKGNIRDILTDPDINIRCGVKHLRDLLDNYKGNTLLAVAAYNAGAGNVNRWLKSLGNLPEALFIENIPFPETREYVKKVLAGMELYRRVYSQVKSRPVDQPDS